jgi:hypothetical protein
MALKTHGFKARRTILIVGVIILFNLFFIAGADLSKAVPIKSYDTTNKDMMLFSSDLSSVVADLKLDTPQKNLVPIGYQKVAQFTIDANDESFSTPLEKITFYDNHDGKEIDKKFDYKVLSYEDVKVTDYGRECEDFIEKNGSKTNLCSDVETGSHTEKKEVWNDFDPGKLTKGTYTIGIFTDVNIGDDIEWMPTYYGVKINEWASWQASYSVGLVAYYDLSSSSGSTVIDLMNNINGTVDSPNTVNWTTGKIGNGYAFNNTLKQGLNVSGTTFGRKILRAMNGTDSTDFTMCYWWKQYPGSDASWILGLWTGDFVNDPQANGSVRFLTTSGASLYTPNLTNAGWAFICIARGTAGFQTLWVNASVYGNASYAHAVSWTGNAIIGGVSASDFSATTTTRGVIDEIGIWNRSLSQTEVTALYNGGNGLNPTSSSAFTPDVTLNAPSNYYNYSVYNVTFDVTVYDYNSPLNITSVNLYLDGALNQTNTSNTNGTYLFKVTGLAGNGLFHNWSISASNNNSLTRNSSTQYFNINTIPFIKLEAPTNTNYYNSLISYIPVNFSFNTSYYANHSFNFYTAGNVTSYSFTNPASTFYNASFADGIWWYNVTMTTFTNQVNTTEAREIFIDTTPPTYNSTGYNSSYLIAKFSILISDTGGLVPNGTYTFSTNNSGSWVNDSTVIFTSNPQWGNVTKSLAKPNNTIVGFQWFFNDSIGNANETPIYTLKTLVYSPVVALTSPASGYNASTVNPVLFNTTEYTTPIIEYRNLTNVTLYTNQTGTFQAVNTTYFVNETHAVDVVFTDSTVYNNSFTENYTVNAYVYNTSIDLATAVGGTKCYAKYDYVIGGSAVTSQTTLSGTDWVSYPASYFPNPYPYMNVSNVDFVCNSNTVDYRNMTSNGFLFRQNLSENFSVTVAQQSMIVWNAYACDTNSYCSFANSNSTLLNIDNTFPIVNITSPFSNITIINFSSTDVIAVPLKWSASDNELSFCTYTNPITHLNVTSSNCNNMNASFNFPYGDSQLSVYANDTFGHETSQNVLFSYYYKLFQTGVLYHPSTTSGNGEDFTLQVNKSSNLTITLVTFYYNNVSYSATYSPTDDYQVITNHINVPVVSSPTNFDFYWSFLMSDGSLINTTATTQTVNPFGIDDCSTLSHLLFNFTMVDEETFQKINGTIDVLIHLYSLGTSTVIATYNGSFQYNVSLPNPVICTSLLLSNYSMGYTIKQTVNSSYFVKYRNAQKMLVSNETNPINMTLYNLLQADGAIFSLLTNGNTGGDNSNLLIEVKKQIISNNTYDTVESVITDNDGSALASLIQSSPIYEFVVSKDGVILGIFSPNQVQCVSSVCSKQLNLNQGTINLGNYGVNGGVDYIEYLNPATKVVSINFTSTDGNPHDVYFVVTQNDGYGNTTFCNATTFANAGTLNCLIPTTYENNSFISNVYSDGTFIGAKFFSFNQKISSKDYYGVDILIELLMYTTMVLLFMSNPILIVIGAILGMLFAITLVSISSGSWYTWIGLAFYFVVAGIVIIWQIRKRI